jgi:hypothetical protein
VLRNQRPPCRHGRHERCVYLRDGRLVQNHLGFRQTRMRGPHNCGSVSACLQCGVSTYRRGCVLNMICMHASRYAESPSKIFRPGGCRSIYLCDCFFPLLVTRSLLGVLYLPFNPTTYFFSSCFGACRKLPGNSLDGNPCRDPASGLSFGPLATAGLALRERESQPYPDSDTKRKPRASPPGPLRRSFTAPPVQPGRVATWCVEPRLAHKLIIKQESLSKFLACLKPRLDFVLPWFKTTRTDETTTAHQGRRASHDQVGAFSQLEFLLESYNCAPRPPKCRRQSFNSQWRRVPRSR